jgi:acyl-CoA thioester hydrolase
VHHIYRLTLRERDLDTLAHANNVSYFDFMQEARNAFLRADAGMADAAAFDKNTFVTSFEVNYRETLDPVTDWVLVHTSVVRIEDEWFELRHQVVTELADGPHVHAEGRSRVAAVVPDFSRQRNLTDAEKSHLESARIDDGPVS